MLDVIEKLLILRDRDKVILQVEAELRGLATERTATQARTADAEVSLAEGKDKGNHIESDRKQLENDAALQQQAKEKYLGQQMQTKDNTEYQAFGRQIKTCENKISEIEDQDRLDVHRSSMIDGWHAGTPGWKHGFYPSCLLAANTRRPLQLDGARRGD